MDMIFCRRCGSPLESVSPGAYACKNKHTLFDNPAPTVGIIFIDTANNITLSVREREPHKGTLDSFGGFVDDQESIEDALTREIIEETRLNPDNYSKPSYFCSETAKYRYDNEDRSVVSLFFWAHLNKGAIIKPNDDVAGTETHNLHDLDIEAIGGSDVKKAVQKLRAIFPRQ